MLTRLLAFSGRLELTRRRETWVRVTRCDALKRGQGFDPPSAPPNPSFSSFCLYHFRVYSVRSYPC